MVNIKDFFNKCLGRRPKRKIDTNNNQSAQSTTDNSTVIELQSPSSTNLLVAGKPNLVNLSEVITERPEEEITETIINYPLIQEQNLGKSEVREEAIVNKDEQIVAGKNSNNHETNVIKNIINAQEWLDKNYPKQERSKIKEIYLNEPNLEGELDLGDFTYSNVYVLHENSVKVYVYPQVDETKLTFKNQPPKGVQIIMINAQKHIDYHYPTKKKKEEVTQLFISNKSIEGTLDLSGFINLEELYCSSKLTSLNVSNCSQLEKIFCSSNLLTTIALPANPNNLKTLSLTNNNFPAQNLSFLVPYINLERLFLENDAGVDFTQDVYNRFTGSLDYLSEMKNLKQLSISNTDINEVDIDKLPRSLVEIRCLTRGRSTCKLTAIASKLEKVRHGWCQKCQQPNISFRWCQLCAEQEWKNSTGQALVKKFIQQQQLRKKVYEELNSGHEELKWIPYEEFTDPEYLAKGGFSKIYKVRWKKIKKYHEFAEEEEAVLKVLNNSANITLEFLQEIANTKLVDSSSVIVTYYGISQDPLTSNYVIVTKYMCEGDLRQSLRQKSKELNFEDKVFKLFDIAMGLEGIHSQNLVHHDFHSGNVLNYGGYIKDTFSCAITDLGLSQLVNSQKNEDKIFGVLPYVAPEVLRNQPYTSASDIYSFGIIAYELFANAYPYYEYQNLSYKELALKICQGYRPNIDEVPIPQLLKDLIKGCWNVDPAKRPNAVDLELQIGEIRKNKNTPFYQQYQALKDEYNAFSKNTPYQIHSNAITHSQPINTKEIAKLFQESEEKAIEAEIKKIEKELSKSFTDMEKELIKEFIETKKKLLKDEEDDELMDNIGELKSKLKEENLSREDIGKVIEYCERFIKSEQELQQENLQVQVEIPITNN